MRTPMGTGRRFVSFWLLLVTACISGCCGCGACGECNDGCNFHLDFGCDGGECYVFGGSDAGQADASSQPLRLATGLAGPTALLADGAEVFYVDRGELVRLTTDGESSFVLATGVGNVGNIATDGVDVFWVGTWSDEPTDGGSDRDPDADADTDTDADADSGSSRSPGIPGVFRVSVTGGDVERLAALDPLPTVETAGAFLLLRARTDDAGGSVLGMLDEDDGGFMALASLSGNTENLHAFALDSAGRVVVLDADGLVRIADAGKSLLATGATGAALLETTSGVVVVTVGEGAYRVLPVFDDGGLGSSVGSGTPAVSVASEGARVFVAEASPTPAIHVYEPGQLSPRTIATNDGPAALLAADDRYVYWETGGTIFRAPIP